MEKSVTVASVFYMHKSMICHNLSHVLVTLLFGNAGFVYERSVFEDNSRFSHNDTLVTMHYA